MIPNANTFPIAENYEKLTPIVERLYQHMDHIAQIALLPMFLLSVLMAYSQDLGLQGAVVSRLKRLVITILLLSAFPSITGLIKNLGQEIALSIDNLQGIDEFLKSASAKASQYSASVKSLLDFGNDLIVSLLVSASYIILYFARYLLVAFYHFYWMILLVTGPLLILGNLFESTSNLARNLFKNLVLVACWPIIWSILSAFLKALPFQDAYAIEGGYTAVVVLNLILAVSLLFSPFMLSMFCEGLIVGSGSSVYAGAKAAVSMIVPKAAAVLGRAGEKMYPVVKNYVPTRQNLYNAVSKMSSRPKVIFLCLIPLLGHASGPAVNIRVGLSSVICFEKAPDYVALGNGKYFQAQKIGNNLLLRSLAADEETNLLVFASETLVASYHLKSNGVLSHTESVDCEKQSLEKLPAVEKKASKRIFSSVSANGLRAELLRKAWESPKHDYFTIKIRLSNQSTVVWKPDWSTINLKQGSVNFSHSGLRSERKEILPGAQVEFDVQFTRPSISKNRGFLVIPSKQGLLELLVEKGASH